LVSLPIIVLLLVLLLLGDLGRFEKLGVGGVLISAMLFVAIVPMSWFYLGVLLNSHETIETMISLKKVMWWGLIYTLAGSVIAAIFGFLAIRHWFISSISPYLYIPVLIAIVFLGTFLGERATAFEYNSIANWLQEHPRGSEVLDEFAR